MHRLPKLNSARPDDGQRLIGQTSRAFKVRERRATGRRPKSAPARGDQRKKRSCEFPSLARSPSRAAGYFSFGKSDTALPKALNFNSSRTDAALAHSTAHTIPHRPRRIETCETHVRLRRSPPFRARNGMEETGGRKSGSLHTLFGEGLQFFARDDRNHAAIICSKRKKSPRCNFPSLPGRPRPPSSSVKTKRNSARG